MRTFVCSNKHLCVGADYWTTHEITKSETELSQILPVEDRAVLKLSVGETYINNDRDRIVTRIA